MVLRNSDSNASLGSNASLSSCGSRRSLGRRSKSSKAPATPGPAAPPFDVAAMRKRFDEFDKDGSGFLEPLECQAALSKLGSKLTFAELDKDGDNKISFEEFTVLTSLVDNHTHPIFKGAPTNRDTTATGISVFAGDAHLNEAFMHTASAAWRKLAETARKKGFTRTALGKCFKEIDLDHGGSLDHGEIRLAIKRMAPELTEVDITLMLACADKDAGVLRGCAPVDVHPPCSFQEGVQHVPHVHICCCTRCKPSTLQRFAFHWPLTGVPRWRGADGKITEEEFSRMMLHDAEADVPYWEKYGARDMHTSGKLANPWL